MGEFDDFPGGMPDGGDPNDPEFTKALWNSLPESVQEKFRDQDQVEVFLRRVESTLKKEGLLIRNVQLGIDPLAEKAILTIQTEFSEEEDQFQRDKAFASMMYDANQERIEQRLEEIRRAAEEGDTGALGLS